MGKKCVSCGIIFEYSASDFCSSQCFENKINESGDSQPR